jgi:glycosyltransferase involved in cell wall biosynthesis
MKVMHVIDSSGVYGAEVMLLNLMSEQLSFGTTPLLLSFVGRDVTRHELIDETQRRGLGAVSFRVDGWGGYGAARRMIDLAHVHGVDVIHCHGYKGDILLGMMPRARRAIPVVSTIHGWISVRKFTKIWLYCMLDKVLLRRLDAVVNVSSSASTIGGVQRFVVENGIPELAFNTKQVLETDQVVRDLRGQGCLVGTVSRLSEEKGIEFFIESIGLLADRELHVKAVVIGDGPRRGHLQRMIDQKGLTESVKLIGFRKDAYHYLPLLDAFVLPSLTEGLPMTILEAMQARVPVVASRVGGVPEVLGAGSLGILVEPRDATAIASALASLLTNRAEAGCMAARARQVVLERYSSRRMAEGYQRVYQTVLSSH